MELSVEDAIARIKGAEHPPDVRRLRAHGRLALPARPQGRAFVSVIAVFSLVGIALGVAALIIVMAVMNGFRQDLLGRILGLNGHLTVSSRRRARPAGLSTA